MQLLFVLGLLLVVAALVLLSMALRPAGHDRAVDRSVALIEALTTAPSELVDSLDSPFSDRVLTPLRSRALSVGRRLSGADAGERIEAKLELAGNPRGWNTDRYIAGRVACAVVGLLVALALGLMLTDGTVMLALIAAAGLIGGYYGPHFYLYQVAYDRSAQLRKDLPDALDMMTISVEAGLGFDAAVQQVSRKTQGPLADEFARMLREMQLGKGRSEALRSLSERTNVDDLKSFVSAMVQADTFGIPIADVLRVQSTEMRSRRRQRAEEKAQQVPVKITVPLIFCILPALFVAVLGPAVINIMDTLL